MKTMNLPCHHTNDLMETRACGTHDESCALCPKSTSCHETICGDNRVSTLFLLMVLIGSLAIIAQLFPVVELKVYIHDNVDIMFLVSICKWFSCLSHGIKSNKYMALVSFSCCNAQQLIKVTKMWNITSVGRLPSETILDMWKKFDWRDVAF